MQKTLADLEESSVITITRNATGNIETVELSDTERQRGREDFDFYCFLIWPYVESNWLAATSMMALIPPLGTPADTWVELNRALNLVQLVRTDHSDEGSDL